MSIESPQTDANTVSVFAALGDATRLELISTLSDGEVRSIAELSNALPLTRQAVSKHLRILERAGLVRCDRIGRESRFAYLPERIAAAGDYLNDVSEQWDKALRRLKSFVES